MVRRVRCECGAEVVKLQRHLRSQAHKTWEATRLQAAPASRGVSYAAAIVAHGQSVSKRTAEFLASPLIPQPASTPGEARPSAPCIAQKREKVSRTSLQRGVKELGPILKALQPTASPLLFPPHTGGGPHRGEGGPVRGSGVRPLGAQGQGLHRRCPRGADARRHRHHAAVRR